VAENGLCIKFKISLHQSIDLSFHYESLQLLDYLLH
jgi:hypothetical protein